MLVPAGVPVIRISRESLLTASVSKLAQETIPFLSNVPVIRISRLLDELEEALKATEIASVRALTVLDQVTAAVPEEPAVALSKSEIANCIPDALVV